MAKFILAVLLCMFSVQSVSATKVTVEDARRKLGQFGVSYCIAQFIENNSARVLGWVAEDGYIQLGFHDEFEAYMGVKKYVIKTMTQNNRSKGQQFNALIQCVDMYEDQKFNKLIRRMDKYFYPENWEDVDDAWIRLD